MKAQYGNEAERLKALYRYGILDTPPEEVFDEIARLAAYICKTPIASVAFVDADREWFKSKIGFSTPEIPRNLSFGAHAILEPKKFFIVSDTLTDKRFKTNPFVTSDSKTRFYAAVPLVTHEGHAIGVLSVSNHLPGDLDFDQTGALSVLGRQVMAHLELRCNSGELSRLVNEHEQVREALRTSEGMYRMLYEYSPSMYFTLDKEGNILSVNQFGAEYLGYKTEEIIGKPILNIFYEDDKDAIKRQLADCLQSPGRVFSLESRKIHKNGHTVWVENSARAVHGADGAMVFLVFCEEITDRKQVEELRRINEELKSRIEKHTAELMHETAGRRNAEGAIQKGHEELTRWINELEHRNRRMVLLNEMGDLLQAGITASEAYAVIPSYAQKIFPDDSGALYVLNTSLNLLEAVVVWGKFPPNELVFEPNKCWALRRGRVHVTENPKSGPLCQHLNLPIPSGYVCAPMVAQGKVLGVLHLRCGLQELSQQGWERLRESAKQQLVVTMAEHIALALVNLRLQETLRNQAIRDFLTGLFNRRYMEETFNRELSRAVREELTLGVIMIDIDDFKQVNDTFGHAYGDFFLRTLSAFLQLNVRKEDVACRYGGDEFVLVLPGASLEDTRKRAEHLREKVKHLTELYGSQPIKTVTLSMGVAIFPEHGLTADEILNASDQALYRAKNEGRDRVVVAESIV